MIHPDVIDTLTARKLSPQTAVITLRDKDILHAIRDTKTAQLPLSFWRNIADHLSKPEAVLLDTSQKRPTLLYVFDLGDGKGKVIVSMDYSFKVKTSTSPDKKERITTNIIRSGKPFEWNEKMRQSLNQYENVYGQIK